MIITRRNLLRSALAAPAIVAIERLMPVKLWIPDLIVVPIYDPLGPRLAPISRKPFVEEWQRMLYEHNPYLRAILQKALPLQSSHSPEESV